MGKYQLDASKITWHQDRVQKFIKGERFYPVNLDMNITRACNYNCEYCFATTQENRRHPVTREVLDRFISDCEEMGIKSISLISDGEITCHPLWVDFTRELHNAGIDVAIGTNGYLCTKDKLQEILPCLTYFRINISAGEADRYAKIHGVTTDHFYTVEWNILDAVEIKKKKKLPVTIGLQMVCKPEYKDDILPLAELAVRCKVDYLVIKHVSDDTDGSLGIDYSKMPELYDTFKKAEALSNETTKIAVKWNKIKALGTRPYKQCYAPPFQLQLSGSGLVAPCGMLFNEKYKEYHIGNICEQSFKEILDSDKYWDVMRKLASEEFDAQETCGSCCLQHLPNIILDDYKKGKRSLENTFKECPQHHNFL